MLGELLKEYWALLTGAAGVVAWLVRMEAGMKRNRDDIAKLSARLDEEQKAAIEHRTLVTTKLDVVGAIVTEVQKDMREVQTDIKNILEKM